ncbi:amidohydrolase family protein [Actinoplanes sp. NPDC051861]|uniref:amidohydrolase family protein n=1 Tax=Actinoplanes sp. NPDC051861 TaxID=3155170 RepID=UPI0034145E92
MDLLVKNARLLSGERADLLVDSGDIVAIRPGQSASAREVIDADGLVVAPGMVDGHRHVWQAPLRGVGADMTLNDYFEAVLGRALAALTPQDARRATLLGAAEALDAGITTVFDWCNATRSPEHTDAVLDAYAEAGIRAVVAHTRPEDTADMERVAALRGRVTGALAILGADRDETARQIEWARHLGVVVSMHASGEVRWMHDAGLLGPHLQLVHMNRMTPDDAKLLADSRTGVTVTPVVEGTMGHGASPFTLFAKAGGRAGLGTDVAVNAPPDLFEPMRDTLRTHRLRTAALTPAGDFLASATIDSARAIGIADRTGSLQAGKRADFILLDGLSHLFNSGDLTGAAVTTLGPADVRTVVVNGRVLKRDGSLTTLDLTELRQETTGLATRATSTGKR